MRRKAGNTASEANCGNCRHFANAPASLEAHLPGLQCMGSGYSSVRDRDGICHFHGLYLSADSVCDKYRSHSTGVHPST